MDPNVKLTFGQLKVGQKFIVFPIPGDDAGHGGFRVKNNVFTKTKLSTLTDPEGLNYPTPMGEVVNIQTGEISSLPDTLEVLLLNF